MKTIRQISKETGVSKTTIHNKLKTEPLSSSLRQLTSTIGRTIYIDDEGENLIKSMLFKERPPIENIKFTPTDDNFMSIDDNSLSPIYNEYITSLQNQIEDLKGRLDKREKEADNFTALMDKQTELTAQITELVRTNQILLGREQSRTNSALLVGDLPNREPKTSEKLSNQSQGFFQKYFKRYHDKIKG